MRPSLACAVSIVAAATPSCWTARAVADADREVAEILAKVEAEEIRSRIPDLVRPEEVGPPPSTRPIEPPGPEPPSAPADAATETPRVDLRAAIRLAVRSSREFQSQRESLYRSALSLTGVRRNFSPRFVGLLSYALSNTTETDPLHTARGSLGVSQILPTGGTVDLGASQDFRRDAGESDPSYFGALSASVRQGLLRGVGYEASHDSLLSAERGLVYAARSFELFRQDFTIQVLTRFYDLVRLERVLRNQRENKESNDFLLARSQALFRVGRAPEVDVFRAQQQAFAAENDLLEAEQTLRDALDDFKIFLGLPTETALEVEEEEPRFVPVRIELARAIEAAYANRLDLLTEAEQLEDARRAVRIAAQALWPDLDFTLSGSLASPATDRIRAQEFTQGAWSAGLSLGFPLDRKAERNAYRSALIDLDQAQRSFDLLRDRIAQEVRSTVRRLERARNTLDIQRRIVESEERRERAAQIRFRSGELSNRDVVEAQRALLDARNAEIADLVTYEIARIQLRRDLGTLLLDEDGLWEEGSP